MTSKYFLNLTYTPSTMTRDATNAPITSQHAAAAAASSDEWQELIADDPFSPLPRASNNGHIPDDELSMRMRRECVVGVTSVV
jgi:hypothetical protein